MGKKSNRVLYGHSTFCTVMQWDKDMEYIKIGKIVNVIGLKGELKIYNYSDPDRYEDIDRILVENKKVKGAGRYEEYHVVSARTVKNMVALKLREITDRTAAEALKERDIYITDEELRELPEDTFYIRDLVGCIMTDVKDDSIVGEITDVLQNGPQDVYEVKLENGSRTYIPAVKEFIVEINIAEKKVLADLIPGFVDNAVEA